MSNPYTGSFAPTVAPEGTSALGAFASGLAGGAKAGMSLPRKKARRRAKTRVASRPAVAGAARPNLALRGPARFGPAAPVAGAAASGPDTGSMLDTAMAQSAPSRW